MVDAVLVPQAIARFSEEARRAVYEVIALRRDVRHFRPGEDVDEATLERILAAAHQAPSVGFSQPWGFVVVRDGEVRARIRASFLRCREAEAARFSPERRAKYLSYRLEGIADAPLNLCVAVDLRSRGEAILGTTAQPEAVRASACCAVQNLWLAARAEGIGVGWVSIVEPAVLRRELALPAGVEPIAYLCIGHPLAFRERPMLEEGGWLPRRPLAEVIHRESKWIDARPAEVAGAPTLPAVREASASSYDDGAEGAARAHHTYLTKPVGSLGRLEELGAWYAGVRGAFPCPTPRASLVVFAADHGVVVEGVSAYGSQITAAMVCNVMAGGAAINVLARHHSVELALVDVGVAGDLSAAPIAPEVPLMAAKVRAGTRNLRREPAMTLPEAEAALAVGARLAEERIAAGASLLGVGEIGIGNTTSGAALVCALTGASPEDVVGRGTGLDEDAVVRKRAVVEDALARLRGESNDPIHVLASIGGLELAAIAGFLVHAARRRVPVVLDGFLGNAAALVAARMDPEVSRFLVASHASAEPGAAIALSRLGLSPLLSLGLRLGEGTGAILGIDLVRSSVALTNEMATFATAGIVRDPP
ncbi:MAG TPA: nicotinate-nucleotide--dimethylbenzimidazole phosphoribosyltransferase [Polyangiaceae bacterium]|jgi:nicotinate-nucleotide--dimethylbenzimidazole phosphoribosyltransferase